MVGSALIRGCPEGHVILSRSRNELDLSNRSEVLDFLKESKPDAIILAAALVGGIRANSINQHQFLVKNLEIQNAVIEGAYDTKVKNLLFLGSSCAYPRNSPQPIGEVSLLSGPLEETNEGYALAKIAGIKLCSAIAQESDLNYFSLMPTNLYGPNDNFDEKASHVPAALMRRFHEAKIDNRDNVVVWGSGLPRREFLHVDDLSSACWKLINERHAGDLINVGTGKDIAIQEFAKLMADAVGYKGGIVFDRSHPDGTFQKRLDITKMQSFGWKHRIPLNEGLRMTYAWFLEALKKGGIRGY